jgi:hypothetical protein
MHGAEAGVEPSCPMDALDQIVGAVILTVWLAVWLFVWRHG